MNKTALLVVDMIYDFTNPNGKVFYPKNEEIIWNLSDFISDVKKHDCLVVYIEHTVKIDDYQATKIKMRECCIEGSGGELTDSRLNCDRKKDIIIKKTKYSAFYNTDLNIVLQKNNIENVIIVGTKTNNCILATAFDSFSRDYITYIVSDLVGTSDDFINEIYLKDINKYLAKVLDSKSIVDLMKKGEL
ncbi:isochorismatase family cysteine hydrolase [Mycoplasmatota bacterium WC30]